ncbi:hypothetical protein ACW9KT_15665 [Hymenobacter sp. HD11105]
MATPEEIEHATQTLRRYPATFSGLRAEVPVSDSRALQDKWRENVDESMLDTPLLSRELIFERPTVEAPWVYIDDVTR